MSKGIDIPISDVTVPVNELEALKGMLAVECANCRKQIAELVLNLWSGYECGVGPYCRDCDWSGGLTQDEYENFDCPAVAAIREVGIDI